MVNLRGLFSFIGGETTVIYPNYFLGTTLTKNPETTVMV